MYLGEMGSPWQLELEMTHDQHVCVSPLDITGREEILRLRKGFILSKHKGGNLQIPEAALWSYPLLQNLQHFSLRVQRCIPQLYIV